MNSHPLAAIATRMSAGHQCFAELAFELFADYGSDFAYERMNEQDRRRLCAAYLRDDPGALVDLVAGLRGESIAAHLADLMAQPTQAQAVDNCDAIDLAGEMWRAIFPNKEIESLVIGELDHQWRTYEHERNERAASEQAEATIAYGSY